MSEQVKRYRPIQAKLAAATTKPRTLPHALRTGIVGMMAVLTLVATLTNPQDHYRPGIPLLPQAIGVIVLAGTLGGLTWVAAQGLDVRLPDALRWLGMLPSATALAPGQRRRTILRGLTAVAAAIALGIAIDRLVPGLLELWPSLDDPSPAQEAAEAGRAQMLTAPLWMVWAHAAGEEVAFRAPLVAATIWAFHERPGAAKPERPSRRRVPVLLLICIADVAIFSLSHAEYSWYNAAAVAVMSTAAAAVAVLTRSVWPAAALHAAYNANPVTWSAW